MRIKIFFHRWACPATGIHSLRAQNEFPTLAKWSHHHRAVLREVAHGISVHYEPVTLTVSRSSLNLRGRLEMLTRKWKRGESSKATFCRLLKVNFKIPDSVILKGHNEKKISKFYPNSEMSSLYSKRMNWVAFKVWGPLKTTVPFQGWHFRGVERRLCEQQHILLYRDPGQPPTPVPGARSHLSLRPQEVWFLAMEGVCYMCMLTNTHRVKNKVNP